MGDTGDGGNGQSLLKWTLEQSAEQSDMVAVVVRLELEEGTGEAEGTTSDVSITEVVEAADDVSEEAVCPILVVTVLMSDDAGAERPVERLVEGVTDAAEDERIPVAVEKRAGAVVELLVVGRTWSNVSTSYRQISLGGADHWRSWRSYRAGRLVVARVVWLLWSWAAWSTKQMLKLLKDAL